MQAVSDLSVDTLRGGARLRILLFYSFFILVTGGSSVVALRSMSGATILLVVMVAVALCVAISLRPLIGLYAVVFLAIAMDSETAGDPISKYTSYFHLDLNSSIHAGIAFTPLELILLVTTVAYLLRAVDRGTFLGGTFAPHVCVFGVFLVFGVVWGLVHSGDWKIGLYEARGPFALVLLYFLVTNLVVERRQLDHLMRAVIIALGIIAIWSVLRFILVFHGDSGGPDGAFGHNHEDAVLLAWLAMIGILRLTFAGTKRQKVILIALSLPALVAMFEMQRRSAFISIFFALAAIAMSLYFTRRRLFFTIVPASAVVLVLYFAAFWNSTSTWAEPVRAWRSQSTGAGMTERDYQSNLYRIAERANVRDTILSAPLTGVGFGRPFLLTHPMVIVDWWAFQLYTPHVEILWIWLKLGALGFIAFWVMICTGLSRAADVIRRERASPQSFACLVCVAYILMLLAFAYVDVGLALQRCEIVLGAMLGVLGASHRLVSQTPNQVTTREHSERSIAAPSTVRAPALS